MQKFVEAGLEFANKQSHINHEEELLRAFSFFDEGTASITKSRVAISPKQISRRSCTPLASL
jgi:Ca2+-binding EF-hand superfamily protein